MAENAAERKKRALKIVSALKKAYLKARCSLDYKSPLQLLAATILSAQCTDARVNLVTPALFKKYRNAREFADADISELEAFVRSTGFYHNKAKNIKSACRMIVDDYDGKVPESMEEILKLPGVARKTANIVLGYSFGVIEGIPVDTHAIRISYLLGLTKNRNPVKIERDLMKIIPRADWLIISSLFVHHGRAICIARRPQCQKCPVEKLCQKKGLKVK